MVDVADPRKPKIISHFLYPRIRPAIRPIPRGPHIRRDSRDVGPRPTSATSAMACSSSPGTACAPGPSIFRTHSTRSRWAT
jgi:hypothetical protein